MQTLLGEPIDDEERRRVGQLVVSFFVRGIESLSHGQKGTPLEVRRVWSASPMIRSNAGDQTPPSRHQRLDPAD